MSEQPTTRLEELEAQCRAFDEREPRVWSLFEKFALEAIKRGATRIGARNVLERVRWELALELDLFEPPRVNNNFAPIYARRFAHRHPKLADRLSFRKQTSADAAPRGSAIVTRTYPDLAPASL